MSDGEKKTVEYWFPQMWDVTVASDENLSIAYHNFKSGGYHDEAVIYDYRQTYESRDGKFLSKVELFSTCCVSTFWLMRQEELLTEQNKKRTVVE